MTDMRLIDADKLEKYIAEKFEEHYGKTVYQFIHDFFRFVIRQIRKAPTIDAAPVVRCKDCIVSYCVDYEDIVCGRTCVNVDADDFCSYGERKEADGNG